MHGYTRKKDDFVQTLLEEHRLLKEREANNNKWMEKGESPTKRLICNYLYFNLFFRNEKCFPYFSPICQRSQEDRSA